MNPTERAAHPSTAQIHALLEFLEKNPSLAKGFSRVPNARDTARKCWEKLALQLNSLGGCVKTWKQWTKYWADKKSAVKKKGALRSRNRNKTGGGKEVVEVELSEIEERILTLMGGESFATGDRHLEINPFFEAQTGEGSEDSPSLLASFQLIGPNPLPSLPMEQQSTPSYLEDLPPENVPVVEVTPQYVTERQAIVCLPGTSGPSSRPSVVRVVNLSPLPMVPSPPCTPPTVGLPASPPAPPTPSGSGSYPQSRQRNTRRQLIISPAQNHPLPNTTTSRPRQSRRGRAGRPSPPSQRRSRFMSFSERFLAIEEQQLEINRRNSELFEMLVNRGFSLLTEMMNKE